MRKPPDEAHLTAWRSLLEAHAAVTDLLERELERERGLALSKFEVLLRLTDAPGGRMRMLELAESVLLSKSGLSRLIDRMEEAGLVRREGCPPDRRGKFAVLTDEGRRVLRRAVPVHLRGIEEHFARHLDGEEARVLARLLDRVNAAARAGGSRRQCPSQTLRSAAEEPEGADAQAPEGAAEPAAAGATG